MPITRLAAASIAPIFALSIAFAQTHGGFVPGQKREPGDPAIVARGKTIYGINCAVCHGADLRVGDLGGPNLLRSQAALSDQHGEMIVPIIQGSRQAGGMPAIPIPAPDQQAVATYVRSVLETIGVQGTPPPAGQSNPNVLIGNAKEGQAYFATKCASCHSVTGDLAGFGGKFPEARDMQTAWVRGEITNRNRSPEAIARRIPTAVITGNSQRIEGQLMHLDEFLVTVKLADGTVHSYGRHGDQPKVEIHDPLKPHRDLLPLYNDRDIHDVTAYLATIK